MPIRQPGSMLRACGTFDLTGILFMEGWASIELQEKEAQWGNVFRKNLRLIGVC